MSDYMPQPSGSGGKILTAFVAGATLGAIAVAQLASPVVAGTPQALNPGMGSDQFVVPGDAGQIDGIPNSSGSQAAGSGGATGTTSGGTQGTTPGTTPGQAGGGDTSSDSPRAAAGPQPDSQQPGGDSADNGGGSSGDSQSGPTVSVDGGSRSGGDGSVSGEGGTSSGCNSSNNGGATDVGVTATEIHVASTVVEDGPGASLLAPATAGMKAHIDKINGKGGICGRRIILETKNDSWDAQRGHDFIRRFIEAKKFALLVVPSSEGLAEAVKAGTISKAGIPVVGTTGLRIDEYREPWVFPVATATVSYMRAMVKFAYDDGARSFAIVWDNKFKFGIEGASAYKDYLKTLPGATLKADRPINPDQADYGTEAQRFNTDCGNTGGGSDCDMTALLVVPETAIKWKNSNPGGFAGRGSKTYGAQTLFTDSFGRDCGDWCDAMVVWTGYNPAIPPVDNKPGVQQYVNDVRAISPSIDYRNQFVEGAYLGALAFTEAAARCSPTLTRACVKDALDAMDLGNDLANTLSWRPGQHHANRYAQAFSVSAGGGFNGWRYEQTGWIRDPGL